MAVPVTRRLFPRAIERSYRARIRRRVETVRKLMMSAIREDLRTAMSRVRQAVQAVPLEQVELARVGRQAAVFSTNCATRETIKVSSGTTADKQRAMRALRIDANDATIKVGNLELKAAVQGVDSVPDEAVDWAAENLELVNGLTEDLIVDLSDAVDLALREGWGARKLAEEINALTGIAERRANTIARDQLGSLNAKVTEEAQTRLGVEYYVWQTAEDERVRPAHRALDGVVRRWDDPHPTEGHPGQAINCRCVALPVFADELDDAFKQQTAVPAVPATAPRVDPTGRKFVFPRAARQPLPAVIDERTPVAWDGVYMPAGRPVPAYQTTEAITVETSWGAVLEGKPGDWVLGEGDDRWIVERDIFDKTYEAVEGKEGIFRKTATVKARRLERDVTVKTLEGDVEAKAGDWLLEGAKGERWPSPDADFNKRGYTKVAEDTTPVGAQLVTVDVEALDQAWMATDFDGYVQPGGFDDSGDAVEGYSGFGQWMADNPDGEIEAGYVRFTDAGRPNFADGAERFAYLRDQGVKQVTIAVESGEVSYVRALEAAGKRTMTEQGELKQQYLQEAGARFSASVRESGNREANQLAGRAMLNTNGKPLPAPEPGDAPSVPDENKRPGAHEGFKIFFDEIGLAYEDAPSVRSARALLEAAQAVGAEPVGTEGQEVEFDARFHQDVSGQAFPGDIVVIERAGLQRPTGKKTSAQGKVIAKARVRFVREGGGTGIGRPWAH